MKKLVCMLMLCITLPALSLAVTEGVVEEAAQVEIEAIVGNAEIAYTLDPSYYASDYGYEPEWGASETYVEPEFDGECFGPSAQWPGLTSGEIVRAKRLLAAYQSGEATGDGGAVLNVTQNVALGVYPVDPADYDGESVFVILPNISITDEQMLSMIDAFHQLGLTFDPEGFSCRNCMRGGGIECTRFFTDEEQERRTTLRDLIRRGRLTGMEPMDELRISLDSRYFNGLDGFSFRPYRRMTDEELAAQLVALGVHDESGVLDFDGIERMTRELLVRAFSCPISMTLENIGREGAYTPRSFDDDGTAYYAKSARAMTFGSYQYPKEGFEYVSATVDIDQESGRVIGMSITDIPIGWNQVETERDPAVPDEAYIAVGQTYVQENMAGWVAQPEALVWHVDNEQEQWWINYGASVRVSARLSETNEMLYLYVGCGDMQVHMVQLEADQRDWFDDVEFQNEDDMPVNG